MTLAEFAVPKNSPHAPPPGDQAAELAALYTEFEPIFASIRASASSSPLHGHVAGVERWCVAPVSTDLACVATSPQTS